VGFGVSTVEQAGALARYADGVIIGSALVSIVSAAEGLDQALPRLQSFLEEAVRAVGAEEGAETGQAVSG
jgi:tryptophan synthase alpha chain